MLVLRVFPGSGDRFCSGVSAVFDCNVATGYVPAPPVPAQGGDCVTTSPGKTLLFTPDTMIGTEYSPIFVILPGQAVILDSYNLVPGYSIFVERLVRSSYCPPVGCACQDLSRAGGQDGVTAFAELMKLGGKVWRLFKSEDGLSDILQIVMTIPGIYRLKLEDPDAQLGTMEVEAQYCKRADLGGVPDTYFAGLV